jgi:hypothetical protein
MQLSLHSVLVQHAMKKIGLLSVLLGSVIAVKGQSRIYVNEYLNIGVGARGLSMAGATTASASDVYSGYWNPAGLVQMGSDVQAGLMHAEYFAGIFKYDYGAIAMPFKDKKRAVGISFIRFATDNIPYTLDYVQPDGSFDDSKLKGFSAGDYAVLLSYAQKLDFFKKNPEIQTRIGANAKILYRNVGSMANAWGFGLDIGVQMDYKGWKFGLTAKDITTSYTAWSFHLTEEEKRKFAGTGNEIPIKSYEVMLPRFNFGIARSFLKPQSNIQVLAELGFDVTTDGKRSTLIASKPVSIDPRLGVEASYKNAIFVRAGLGNFYRALDNADTNNIKKYTVFQPSLGVGFKVKSFSVDYAFTSLQMQDNPLMSHIVSIRLDIFKARKTAPDAGNQPAPAPVKPTEEKNKKG